MSVGVTGSFYPSSSVHYSTGTTHFGTSTEYQVGLHKESAEPKAIGPQNLTLSYMPPLADIMLNQNNHQIKILEEEVARLKAELSHERGKSFTQEAQLQSEITALSHRMNLMKNGADNNSEEIEKLLRENKRLSEKIASLQSSNNNLSSQLFLLKGENETLDAHKRELQKQVKIWIEKFDGLERGLTSKHELNAKLNALASENIRIRDINSASEREVTELKLKVQSLQGSSQLAQEHSKRVVELEEKVRVLNGEKSDLELKVTRMMSREANVSKETEEMAAEIRKKYAEVVTDNQHLQIKMKELLINADDFMKLKKKLIQTESLVKELELKLVSLSQSHLALRSSHSELQELPAEVSRLKNQNFELERQVELLTKENISVIHRDKLHGSDRQALEEKITLVLNENSALMSECQQLREAVEVWKSRFHHLNERQVTRPVETHQAMGYNSTLMSKLRSVELENEKLERILLEKGIEIEQLRTSLIEQGKHIRGGQEHH